MQEKEEKSTKILKRLSYFLEYKGESFSHLAANIGLSNSYFSKMVRNNGSLGEDVIRKILLYYENINPEWLLLGAGSMTKENQIVPQLTDMYVSEMIQLICKLSEENGSIKAEKRQLKEEIKQLKIENEKILSKIKD